MLNRLWRYFAAACLVVGVFGAQQLMSVVAASAAPVPPPQTCYLGNDYDFSNPDCYGTAKNPPAGCLTGVSVNNTPACMAWKATTPFDLLANSATSDCKPPNITGADGACCAATDTECLNGSILAPQGDPAALAAAKKICNDVQGLKGITVPSAQGGVLQDQGNSGDIIPAGCLVAEPTLASAQAACIEALDLANQNFSDLPIWQECSDFAVTAAGELPPVAAPAPGDAALAKAMCKLLLANPTIAGDPSNIPEGCSTTPGPQDGVIACKYLIETTLNLLSGDQKAACTDLIERNPANQAGLQTNLAPQHVQFDDADLQKLSGGLAFFALALCMGGIMVSGAMWAIGSKGNNEGQQLTGKRGIIVCCVAALIIGGLPSIFSFYDNIAHGSIDDNQVTAKN